MLFKDINHAIPNGIGLCHYSRLGVCPPSLGVVLSSRWLTTTKAYDRLLKITKLNVYYNSTIKTIIKTHKVFAFLHQGKLNRPSFWVLTRFSIDSDYRDNYTLINVD